MPNPGPVHLPSAPAQAAASRPPGVENLIRLAQELSLEDVDLDELVYDALHADASDAVNNGTLPELAFLDAFDAEHDDADEKVSRINNQGLEAQIETLVTAYGVTATEQQLRDLTNVS